MSIFDGKTVLVTGGTGSFGRMCIRYLLNNTSVRRAVVFSRDELKQFEMQQMYPGETRLRFFLGDVRDYERLYRSFDGVEFVIHAAALKQVPAAEYNPFEAVKTNIQGAQNIIEAAINQRVERVIALSTDKACCPVNLYGATKLVSDKLFVGGNAYAGGRNTKFSVVRYGNVIGSRGSVIPFFRKCAHTGELPITDERMTRFWITLQQGVQFVVDSIEKMHGGEIFVPKIPSMRIVDLARAIAPDARIKIIGIRPGEKLHEVMIGSDDARKTMDIDRCYVVEPDFEWWSVEKLKGKPVPDDFCYASNTNDQWLGADDIREMIQDA